MSAALVGAHHLCENEWFSCSPVPKNSSMCGLRVTWLWYPMLLYPKSSARKKTICGFDGPAAAATESSVASQNSHDATASAAAGTTVERVIAPPRPTSCRVSRSARSGGSARRRVRRSRLHVRVPGPTDPARRGCRPRRARARLPSRTQHCMRHARSSRARARACIQ